MRGYCFGTLLITAGLAMPAEGQQEGPPPLYPGYVAKADGSRLTPGRVEFEERTVYPNDSTDIDSYTYVTLDGHHSWSERQLVVDWVALTWNGTGFDRNVVAERGLDLRSRATPRGIPLGVLLESHYYPGGSRVVRANPDGGGVLELYDVGNPEDLAVYNEIVSPYLLAALDLEPGMRFIVPDFTPYSPDAPLRYRLFVVRDEIEVPDELGHVHRGMRVDAVTRATVTEAYAAADSVPDRFVSYLVSSSPPHFLGKRWTGWTDGEGRVVSKEWRLLSHQNLAVTPSNHLDDILRVRARRGRDQELPWGDSVEVRRAVGSGC